MYKGIQPLSCGITQKHSHGYRDIILCNNSCSLRVVHVMMQIGDLIRKPYHLTFQSRRISAGTVIQDAVNDLPGQVQPFAVLLQNLHHPCALLIVGKAARTDLIQSLFSGVTKRCMSQIMAQRNGLHQILIQSESLGNGTGNLRNLQCMSETVSVMISLRRQKNLSLILQSAKRLTVKNPVSVPLKYSAHITFFFRPFPSYGSDTAGSIGT